MLRRDPLYLATFAVTSLVWVSLVGVCIMGAMYWRYERAEEWAWLSVLAAGKAMVLTFWLIAAAAERDREAPPAKRQPAAVGDEPRIKRLDTEDFQTLVRLEYSNWPNIRRDRIHRAIQIVLKVERASVRVLKDARLNETEAAEFRAWLKRNGWGDEYRNSIVLNATGREELEKLSPIARGLHR